MRSDFFSFKTRIKKTCPCMAINVRVQYNDGFLAGIIHVRSTCPLLTNSGCGKREAHINWSMVTCQGSTRYWNYLEDYWPCAGRLSAVNVIGTQLRDPINSALTQWRMAV